MEKNELFCDRSMYSLDNTASFCWEHPMVANIRSVSLTHDTNPNQLLQATSDYDAIQDLEPNTPKVSTHGAQTYRFINEALPLFRLFQNSICGRRQSKALPKRIEN